MDNESTSPVGAFPPNGYGLFDLIGNVWEWTTDFYQAKHPAEATKACCVAQSYSERARRATTTRQPAIKDSAKSDQGGSAVWRAELLPALSTAARFPTD
jgi:formylglycine-generating enzyme required for sulfatase activity